MGISPDPESSQTKATSDSNELRYVCHHALDLKFSSQSTIPCSALTTALKAAFAKQEPDPRTRFHERFQKEADEYDRDFHKKYHDDLNTILIFVSQITGRTLSPS